MKKARVLLLTPNLVGVKDGLNRIQPSLGVMSIAQVLIDQGHVVKIYDTALEGWSQKKDLGDNKVLIGQSDEEIETAIREFNPDVVGISILFSNLNYSGHNLAKIIKKIDKSITVILGGNHVSNSVVDYENFIIHPGDKSPIIKDLEDPNFDFAIIGESDFIFATFVNKIIKGEDYSALPGLAKKIPDGSYKINPTARIEDVTKLPIPARNLVNMEGYFSIFGVRDFNFGIREAFPGSGAIKVSFGSQKYAFSRILSFWELIGAVI